MPACVAGRRLAREEDSSPCQRDRHAPCHAAQQGAAARVSQNPPCGTTLGTTPGRAATQEPNCPEQHWDVAVGQ